MNLGQMDLLLLQIMGRFSLVGVGFERESWYVLMRPAVGLAHQPLCETRR